MTILRVVARPLLASAFIYGGVTALRNTKALAPRAEAAADAAQSVKNAVAPNAPIPTSPETLVRAAAVVHIGAGAALATGRVPRTSALVLAGSLLPITATSHQFWNEPDPSAKANQRVHFAKNISLIGGLLLSILDPDPHKPALVTQAREWRRDRKALKQARSEERAKKKKKKD